MPPEARFACLSKILTTALFVLLVSSAWAAPQYKVLHAFTAGDDGGGIMSGLLLDNEGSVYGTTISGGGPKGHGGTVFKLTPLPDGTWSFRVLYSFCSRSNCEDGGGPFGGLIFDQAGNLYGTAISGGVHDSGVVFELDPNSQVPNWTETVLYDFCSLSGCSDGGSPWAGVIMDSTGNLYGTAGVAFELSPGTDGWKEKVLHTFCNNNDGCESFPGLVWDNSGNLYGTTEGGGVHKAGTVYRLELTSGGWKEQILHSFPASPFDGQVPGVGALLSDPSGSLFGTTNQGGRNTCVDVGCGTIFKLNPASNGKWKETILYNFTGKAGGSGPSSGVVMDKAGNLYGVTIAGGDQNCPCGVVYKLAASPKGKWTYTVLHRFTGFDGAQPDANLILDGQGNLYGTTLTGGSGGAGGAFELTP